MDNALIEGLLTSSGLLPAMLLAWLRHSRKEPTLGSNYTVEVALIWFGIALMSVVRDVLGSPVDPSRAIFFVVVGSLVVLRGELGNVRAGRVRARWATRRAATPTASGAP